MVPFTSYNVEYHLKYHIFLSYLFSKEKKNSGWWEREKGAWEASYYAHWSFRYSKKVLLATLYYHFVNNFDTPYHQIIQQLVPSGNTGHEAVRDHVLQHLSEEHPSAVRRAAAHAARGYTCTEVGYWAGFSPEWVNVPSTWSQGI